MTPRRRSRGRAMMPFSTSPSSCSTTGLHRPRSDRLRFFIPPAWFGTGCTAKPCSRGFGCGQSPSTGKSVNSLCSLGLTPEFSIHDIEKTDIIILPASGWDVIDKIAKNTPLLPWLSKWHSRGAYIAGICTGVAFLAECGLLDGRQATTHWGVADILRERYPESSLAAGTVRHRRRPASVQRRRLCRDRPQPLSG